MPKQKIEPVYSPIETMRFGVSDKYPQGNSGANYLGGAIAFLFFGLITIFSSIVAGAPTAFMIVPIILIGIGIIFVMLAVNNWGKPTSGGKYAHKRFLEKEELRKKVSSTLLHSIAPIYLLVIRFM